MSSGNIRDFLPMYLGGHVAEKATPPRNGRAETFRPRLEYAFQVFDIPLSREDLETLRGAMESDIRTLTGNFPDIPEDVKETARFCIAKNVVGEWLERMSRQEWRLPDGAFLAHVETCFRPYLEKRFQGWRKAIERHQADALDF